LILWSEVLVVQEAVDAWSLGVMAFELLTGKPALNRSEGRGQVLHSSKPYLKDSVLSNFHVHMACGLKLWHDMQAMDRIEGLNGKQLPWEGQGNTRAIRKRLGIFKAPIISLLSRDPLERPSMAEFCNSCNRVLAGSSSVQQ
jgi:serine/threonine protein kinase